jgi:hypothetical protein
MKWLQVADAPQPPDWFVRELKLIDPTLRAVWGLERYLREEWAIERKTSAENYWLMYESLLTSDEPRFVDQPVYDCEQRETDPITGIFIGYKQVGIRKYDLAPEFEWVAFRPTLDQALLTLIKKLYWERDHPEEVAAAATAEAEAKEKSDQTKIDDAKREGIDEAFLEVEKVRQFGYGKTRKEQFDK